MSETPNIREYIDADREAIFTLLHRHMQFASLDESFWNWKFKERVSGDKTLGFVAEVKKEVIGFCSFTPYRFSAGRYNFIGWQAADVVVHTDYRRKGLFRLMYSKALEIFDKGGSDFTFCFSSEMAYDGYNKMGYIKIGTLPYYVLFPDLRRLLSRKLPAEIVSWFPRSLMPKNKCRTFVDKMSLYRDSLLIYKNDDFPEDIKFRSDDKNMLLHVRRDANYLEGRYVNHPWNKYEINVIQDNDHNLLGYLILKGGNLIDIYSYSDEYFGVLLSIASQEFLEKHILMAHTYLQCDANKMKLLKKAGFFPYRWRKRLLGAYSQQIMMVRKNPLKDCPLNIYDKNNWYFSMGDIALGL